MQVNDNGTASYFAVLEKSSAAQKERIEKKDQIDYEISQCLKENEYDRVVEIYENKLEVFQKQERKA